MEQQTAYMPDTDSITAKASRGSEVLEIVYSEGEKNKQVKKAMKNEQLKQNPETLFADFSNTENGRKKTDLLFHTENTEAWHTAFCKYYKNITKGGICMGRQIKVRDEEDSCVVLTLNIYHNGTIMAQGIEEQLEEFEHAFPLMKDQAKDLKTSDKNDEKQMAAKTLSMDMPDVPSPNMLRDCLSHLERDFVQSKEQLQRQLGDNGNANDRLREELNTLKSEHKSALLEIQSTIQQLQQDNTQLREEINILKSQMIPNNQETELKRMVCPDKVPINKQQTGETHQPPKINITKPSNSQDNCKNPETPNKPSNHKNRQQNPEIVLIIDSNGKYLNTKRLFPGTRVQNSLFHN